MREFKRVDAADLKFFEELMPGRVFSGEAISTDYDHDEMTEYGHFMPEAVLQALTAEEISKVLAYCNEKEIAVTPRGAGTGLCGGCVAIHGGIVLSTEKMKKVIEVDTKNMTATVEPGVLLMEFPKSLEGTGLFYPPDPGEKTATMGGKNVKTSSGYSLVDLMIGSEGTLGFLTQMTVKLIPEPKANLSLLIPFDDLDACISAVPDVLACGCEPTAVEFMEREVISCAEMYLGKQFPDTSADAYLLVRLDGASMEALKPSMDALTDLALGLGAKDVLMADTDERKESIWSARGAFLEAIKGSTSAMDECDVVVPRDGIAKFVRATHEISKRYDIRICSFGHAGDGNLHVYVCRDELDEAAWKERVEKAMDDMYEVARGMGGDVSGEHGIGHAKKPFLMQAVGEVQLEHRRGIKAAFDPKGLRNPGKVV